MATETDDSNWQVQIRCIRDGLLPGEIVVEDLCNLAGAFHAAIRDIIRAELGLPSSGGPRETLGDLSALVVTSLGQGSSTINLRQNSRRELKYPAQIVAAQQLARGLEQLGSGAEWPGYLPESARASLYTALSGTHKSGAKVELSVRRYKGSTPCRVELQPQLIKKLADSPRPRGGQLTVVGRLFGLNSRSRTIRIDAGGRTVHVDAQRVSWDTIDALRWKRVCLRALPKDRKARKLVEPQEIRQASESETDGVFSYDKATTPMWLDQLRLRVDELASLCKNWDTYGANEPSRRILDDAYDFVESVVVSSAKHGIDLVAPFAVPLPTGSVQLEWEHGGRVLELEVLNQNEFRYLLVDAANGMDENDDEGECDRWFAMRLTRWLMTGEEP